MSLMYAARMLRADLLQPIGSLATTLTKWTVMSDLKLQQLYSYVSSTVDISQVNRIHKNSLATLCLAAYPDADLAGGDSSCRSTSGGCLFIHDSRGGGFLLAAWSKRQTSTATSTAESEMTSLQKCTKDYAIPAQSFWDQVLRRATRCDVYEDNSAVVSRVRLGYSIALRALAKHTRLSISCLSELYSNGDVLALKHIVTARQRGDLMTKGLSGPKLEQARIMVGLLTPQEALPSFDPS